MARCYASTGKQVICAALIHSGEGRDSDGTVLGDLLNIRNYSPPPRFIAATKWLRDFVVFCSLKKKKEEKRGPAFRYDKKYRASQRKMYVYIYSSPPSLLLSFYRTVLYCLGDFVLEFGVARDDEG